MSRTSVDLFAVQPLVSLRTYTRLSCFKSKVISLLNQCQAKRRGEHALICFPEYFCGFLSAAGHASIIKKTKTLEEAMLRIALRKLPVMIWTKLRYGKNLKEAFLLSEGKKIASFILPFFSEMARKTHCYLLLGSALLPGETCSLKRKEKGKIYNTAIVFNPKGEIIHLTRKVNLVPGMEDQMGLSAGSLSDIKPFDTPFGKVGVAICYDGFCIPHTRYERFQDVTRRLDQLETKILIQPSANPWPWDAPWAYGSPQEALLRKEQWSKEGLEGQLDSFCSIQTVVNPMLHGSLFDLSFDGASSIWVRNARWSCAVHAKRYRQSEEILLCRLKLQKNH